MRMILNKTSYVLMLVILLFVGCYIAYNEMSARRTARQQIFHHAQVIAEPLWIVDTNTPVAYLELAVRGDCYDKLTILFEDGSVFLAREGQPLVSLSDRLFARLGLMPQLFLTSDVEYRGKRIGRVEATARLKAVYADLYAVVLGLFFLLAAHLYLRLVQSNRALDVKVRQRTANLEEEIKIRRKAEEELQEKSRMQRLLVSVAASYINLPLDEVDARNQESLRSLAEFVGADRASVYEYDFARQMVTMTHCWRAMEVETPLNLRQSYPLEEGGSWDTERHRRGETIWISDVTALPPGRLHDLLARVNTKSSLSFPLMHADACIGFVGLGWTKQQHDYSPLEQDLLTVFANMLVNIRLRKRSGEEIQSLKNYLSNIIESMPSILVGMDGGKRVTQWNRHAEAFTGISASEALGQPVAALLPDFSHWIESQQGAIETRRPASLERDLLMRNGERHFYDLMLYPLVANGVEGAVVRIEDVTERALVQELMVQTEKMMTVGGARRRHGARD